MLATTTDALGSAWTNVSVLLATFLPKLIVAVLVVLAGWIVASIVGGLIARAFGRVNIDRVWQELGLHEMLDRAGYRFNLGNVLGAVIKWIIIFIALFAALDILGLHQVNDFLGAILAYIPNVIAAALILGLAGLLANFLSRLVSSSGKAIAGFSPALVGPVVKWSLLAFGFLAAFSQLGIATSFMQMLFGGIVFAFSLALGLAYGLGGREQAARSLERLKDRTSGQR